MRTAEIPRTPEDWRALARTVRATQPGLEGWHHGTLWMGGTPMPLLIERARERGWISEREDTGQEDTNEK